MNDVDNPFHYNRKGIECIQAIEASMSEEEFKGYLKGNTLKYIWRYTYKGKPLEDLKKAEWYLKKLMEKNQMSNEKTVIELQKRIAELREALSWIIDSYDSGAKMFLADAVDYGKETLENT